MNCINLNKARSIYQDGGNVSEFLRSEMGDSANNSDIIEIAYDLQAGTYINFFHSNLELMKAFAEELAMYLNPHLSPGDILLDVGSGELTTLSLMLQYASQKPASAIALDISWSRLNKGIEFWHTRPTSADIQCDPLVADIRHIPLATSSADVVTSVHALEPNGGKLPALLREIFRVARKHAVLFEPSYELNSTEGKARMDRLGYIKDIEKTVNALGGKVLDVQLLENINNVLNPTACYIIEPPQGDRIEPYTEQASFTVPGTDYLLKERDGFLVSAETGLVFPVLKGIPVLKEGSGILATSYFD